MATDDDADLTDAVFRHTVGDSDEYAYVAEDRDGTVVLWLYTRATGFDEIRQRDRSDFIAADWERVEGLPDDILAQVSGDEVPYEPT